MADFSFDIRGLDRIQRKLAALAKASPGTFDNVVGRWAKRTANQLQRRAYPPTRPGQRYRRTRTLKRSWQALRLKSLEWRILNRASRKGTLYASFVVGDRQAWMHTGRWWKASEEIEAKVPNLVEMLEDDIKRFLF